MTMIITLPCHTTRTEYRQDQCIHAEVQNKIMADFFNPSRPMQRFNVFDAVAGKHGKRSD